MPNDKYYGAQTVRSTINFPIGGERERMPVSEYRSIIINHVINLFFTKSFFSNMRKIYSKNVF